MPSHVTRPSLLQRLGGDQDELAWREFDLVYRELIIRYCRSSGLQQADAEDVRQVVMMNLARALPGFRYDPQKGRFRAYLGQVARNAVRRYIAGERATLQEPTDGFREAAVAEPEDPVWEREWMLHHYRRAMATLRRSFEARSVAVFDSLLGGETVAQVAAQFEMGEAAVQKVKQRVRTRLQELVARQIEEEG